MEEGDRGNFIYKPGILDYNRWVWNMEKAFGVRMEEGFTVEDE